MQNKEMIQKLFINSYIRNTYILIYYSQNPFCYKTFSKSNKMFQNNFFESTEYTSIVWQLQVQGIISMIPA